MLFRIGIDNRSNMNDMNNKAKKYNHINDNNAGSTFTADITCGIDFSANSDMNSPVYDVIIIGAGASGLFAAACIDLDSFTDNAAGIPTRLAYQADSDDITHRSFKGLILEKTPRPGTKLLMSGSGQCNITHSGSIKDFVKCYGNNGKKIRSCLYKYNNISLMDFLHENGIETFIRDDGKVFPASMDAHDVLFMLLRRAKKNGFEIKYNSPVTGISRINKNDIGNDLPCYTAEIKSPVIANHITKDLSSDVTSSTSEFASSDIINYKSDGIADNAKCTFENAMAAPVENLWQIVSDDKAYLARSVIIATGGCSYPTTGSDGSMLKVLSKNLDIDITKLKPALSSIQLQDYPYSELSGISFKDIHTSIWHDGRKTAETVEDLLFTHKDLSGPAIINISKFAEANDKLRINYLYPLNYEQALEKLKAAMHGAKGSPVNVISTAFDIPKRFCQIIVEKSGTSLKSIASSLTGDEFVIASVSGFNKAMATSGGIDLKQINTSTFEFKAHPGLYAIGEALDIDGITGGYNLQFAYSSAMAAVTAIAK